MKPTTEQATSTQPDHRPEARSHHTPSRRQQRSHDSKRSTFHVIGGVAVGQGGRQVPEGVDLGLEVSDFLLDDPDGVGAGDPAQRRLVLAGELDQRVGDRQLNRALHTIVLVRLRDDPDTRADMTRRTAEGKGRRDSKRCLRRIVARQLFRLLERYDHPGVEILRAA